MPSDPRIPDDLGSAVRADDTTAVPGTANEVDCDPQQWLNQNANFFYLSEQQMIVCLAEIVDDPMTPKDENKKHRLLSFIQQLAIQHSVQVPIHVVIGIQSAGKTRYVEYLLNCLPIGYSAEGRATVMSVVYMLSYSPELAATGNGTVYRVKLKANSRAEWTDVPIGSLGHRIAEIQKAVLASQEGLSHDWMLVSIYTNDPKCQPRVVVDVPGQISADPAGNPGMVGALRSISSRLLSRHRGQIRVTVVGNGNNDAELFTLFQEADFNVKQYDTADSNGTRISFLLTHADEMILRATRNTHSSPSQALLNRVANYQGVTGHKIPSCLATLHHPSDYPPEMTMAEVMERQQQNRAAITQGIQQLQQLIPSGRPSTGRSAPKNFSFNLEEWQKEEDARFHALMRSALRETIRGFERERDTKRVAYEALMQHDKAASPEEFATKLSRFCSQFARMIADLYAGRRLTKSSHQDAINQVYEEYGHKLSLVEQCKDPIAASCAGIAWEGQSDDVFTGIIDQADKPIEQQALAYQRFCTEARVRMVSHHVPHSEDYPSDADIVNQSGSVNQIIVPANAAFELAKKEFSHPRFAMALTYILIRMKLLTATQFQMAFDLLHAAGEVDFASLPVVNASPAAADVARPPAPSGDADDASGVHDAPAGATAANGAADVARPPFDGRADAAPSSPASSRFREIVMDRIYNVLLHQWVDQFLARRFASILQSFNKGGFRESGLALLAQSAAFIFWGDKHAPPPDQAISVADIPAKEHQQMLEMARTDLDLAVLRVASIDLLRFNEDVYTTVRCLFRHLFNYLRFSLTMDMDKTLQAYPVSFIIGGVADERLSKDLEAALMGGVTFGPAIAQHGDITAIINNELMSTLRLPQQPLRQGASTRPLHDKIPLYAGDNRLDVVQLSELYERGEAWTMYDHHLQQAKEEYENMDRMCTVLTRAKVVLGDNRA